MRSSAVQADVAFPVFGQPAWAMNKTMYEETMLPNPVVQVAVLVTVTLARSELSNLWPRAPSGKRG